MAERVILKNPFNLVRYDIELEPDLEKFTFDGLVKIGVDITAESKAIVLHAKELGVWSADFTHTATGAKATATNINYCVSDNTVEFVFADPLPLGAGVLRIVFVGQLNDQMAGFYRSPYTDANGVSKLMASTQFEALDARRAFPCVDEPAAKV